ncbi:MAG: HutD family protein [Proteobacteria bacterium]|nr:HutD family protein [Pseudomonadota bacterium]
MSGWERAPARNFRAMRWRNGGGTTWEIGRGCFQDDAAEAGWHWRFSLAEITTDGPFSAFPGVDRWLTVVTGEGVALTVDGAPARQLHRGDDIQFQGESEIGCALLSGPTRDLNLMVDRRLARLVPGGGERRIAALGDDVVVLYAMEDVALQTEAERIDLTRGDALIGRGGGTALIEGGRAAWARVERRAPR